MKSVNFSEYHDIYETYSSLEYDRMNKDLPSFDLMTNAIHNRAEFFESLKLIYQELNTYKKNEMYVAQESQANTRYYFI